MSNVRFYLFSSWAGSLDRQFDLIIYIRSLEVLIQVGVGVNVFHIDVVHHDLGNVPQISYEQI